MKLEKRSHQLMLVMILSAFLYLIGNNMIALTDPDEAFYSLTAKEMMANKSFLTPMIFNEAHFEKPPLTFWLLMISFKIFGINAFAARLIPAIFGLLGVLGTYFFLKKVFNEKIAFYSALILSTSILYLGLSKALLTDMVFSVFVFFSFYAFYLWYKKDEKNLNLFAVSLALAVLTKGPVAVVILFFGVGLFMVLSKEWRIFKEFLLNRWWILFLIISLPWYIYVTVKYGRVFFDEFIINDNWRRILFAEHKNFDKWYFYPAVILVGAFPWTFYFLTLGANFKKYKKEYIFLFSMITSVFCVFTLAHSKLISYIVPLYPAIAILLGLGLTELSNKPKRVNLIGILNIVLGAAILPAPFIVKSIFPDFFLAVLCGVIVLSVCLILSGIMLLKKEFVRAIYLNIIGLILVAITIVFTLPFKQLESAFSDNDLPKAMAEYDYYQKPILCGKLFVRGVYFNTGSPVKVLGKSDNPFWSKHPVEVINVNNDGKVINFFNDNYPVLCVITSKDLKHLDEILSGANRNKIYSESLGRAVVLIKKATK